MGEIKITKTIGNRCGEFRAQRESPSTVSGSTPTADFNMAQCTR